MILLNTKDRYEYWGMEVPEDVSECRVRGNRFHMKGDFSYFGELPPGSWQIHCTLSSCTEEQAAEVVEAMCEHLYDPKDTRTYYRDYTNSKNEFANPKESISSLCRSKGLKNCIILKKDI
jgi:hypothetical protein